jgi:hypothetical protein
MAATAGEMADKQNSRKLAASAALAWPRTGLGDGPTDDLIF